MDNMLSHKAAGVIELMKSVGAEIKYLPSYSPDLNPLELMWSNMKSELRSQGKVKVEELIEATGRALSKITPEDAQGWYKHCGYYS